MENPVRLFCVKGSVTPQPAWRRSGKRTVTCFQSVSRLRSQPVIVRVGDRGLKDLELKRTASAYPKTYSLITLISTGWN